MARRTFGNIRARIMLRQQRVALTQRVRAGGGLAEYGLNHRGG